MYQDQRELAQVETVYQLIQYASTTYSNHTAITFLESLGPDWKDSRLTFQQYLQMVNRCGRLFRSYFGDKRGVVSILLPNIPQNHIALWAGESVGIANPLNPLLSADALAGLMLKAKTDVVVALGPNPMSDIWQKAQAAAAQIAESGGEAPKLIPVLSAEQGAPHFDELLTTQSVEDLPESWLPSAGDTAAYFHTGGTTGLPKLALHTHTNQLYVAKAYADVYKLNAGSVGINGLPMFHVGGAIVNALSSIAKGLNTLLPTIGGFRNPEVIQQHWRIVEQYKVALSGGIPTSVAAIAATPVEDANLSSLKYMIAGGAPVPASLCVDVNKVCGVPLYALYGMTETAALITLPNIQDGCIPGSAGVIADGVQVKIDGAQELGDTGEICVSGPMVFPGYLKHDEQVLDDGWLRTGDLGYQDKHNNLFITGRAKDLIIRSGHNIDPAMIEHCLEDHPAVALAAAIGQPDSYAGELPIAFVQLHPDQEVTAEQLRDHAMAHIDERPACPKRIEVMQALPQTAVGKIHKPTLRAIAAEFAVGDWLAHNLPNESYPVEGKILESGLLQVLMDAPPEVIKQVADALNISALKMD